MQPCNIRYVPIFILTTLTSSAITNRTSSSESNIWRRAGKMTGLLLNECFRSGDGEVKSPEQFLLILRECVKERSLSVFDRTMAKDVIELLDGVVFVRYPQQYGARNNRYLKLPWTDDKYDRGNDNWKNHLIRGLQNLFRTHVLKIRLTNLDPSADEARGRRKNNMFTQMLMFGLVTAAIIVIPMGFQFLAILGGKALLLAKMALLLTAIQGLKKIATSNYNYGLYSTYGTDNGPCKKLDQGCDDPYSRDIFVSIDIEGADGHYDRQWHPDTEGAGLQNYGVPEGYSQILHPRREVLGDWQT